MENTVQAKTFMRMRLSSFLIVCTGIGAILGLGGKYYASKVEHRQLIVYCNGYRVESYWEKTSFQRERLVYLVAFAASPMASGNYAEGDEWGFSRHDSGLYLEGKLYSSSDKKGWVYVNYGGPFGKLEQVPSDVFDDFTYNDFERLERSDVWRRQFKPLLDQESATFAKMHKESPGPTAFWNRGNKKPEIHLNH